MEAALIESIGKLATEVVAILALTYVIYYLATRISKSIDRLADATYKKAEQQAADSKALRESVDGMSRKLDEHHEWAYRMGKRFLEREAI